MSEPGYFPSAGGDAEFIENQIPRTSTHNRGFHVEVTDDGLLGGFLGLLLGLNTWWMVSWVELDSVYSV